MKFYEIEFPLAGLNSDTVEAALMEAGASAITFLDRADEPILEPKPGEFRLWSDTLVRALFKSPPIRPATHCITSHSFPPPWARTSPKRRASAPSRIKPGSGFG